MSNEPQEFIIEVIQIVAYGQERIKFVGGSWHRNLEDPLKVLNILLQSWKSLPSNAGLMVGKRVLQGEAWSDLSDSRGTHDLGDK
ncbi:hypothetical protein AVEN_100828-1 [Araneus ventricosus]|uniref:Uncharacterized protein n=1 Tax=Araneus ventricosus TaxID=182803 RepID=A0A4Y2AWM3_ARAVE|nr:hypothetical protein AVEN_100828-1 [Araneus ventricosus]